MVAFDFAFRDLAHAQDAALEFLLELVRTESLDAETAIEAVLRSMPPRGAAGRRSSARLRVSAAGVQRLALSFEAKRVRFAERVESSGVDYHVEH